MLLSSSGSWWDSRWHFRNLNSNKLKPSLYFYTSQYQGFIGYHRFPRRDSLAGNLKQLIFTMVMFWPKVVWSCLLQCQESNLLLKRYNKPFFPSIIIIDSLQNTSQSSCCRIPIHIFSSCPHWALLKHTANRCGVFFLHISRLMLVGTIHCPLKIGLLQNWPLWGWNSSKETEESRKIKDNKMLQPENCLSQDTHREGSLL